MGEGTIEIQKCIACTTYPFFDSLLVMLLVRAIMLGMLFWRLFQSLLLKKSFRSKPIAVVSFSQIVLLLAYWNTRDSVFLYALSVSQTPKPMRSYTTLNTLLLNSVPTAFTNYSSKLATYIYPFDLELISTWLVLFLKNW